MLSISPTLEVIGPVSEDGLTLTVQYDAPIHIGLDGADEDSAGAIEYAVVVKNLDGTVNTDVTAQILAGNPSVKITLDDVDGDGVDEVMILELFEGRAAATVAQFRELVQAGFYDSNSEYDMKFHRIIDNFMIQGGDPLGTGTGGSGPNGTKGDAFDDEFHPDLRHTNYGVLSMANSGADTNDSQFFITDADTRWLDFDHTVFGQLNEGAAVLEYISGLPTNAYSQPTPPVIVKSMEIIEDTENATLFLSVSSDTPLPAGSTIEITLTDSDGDHTTVSYALSAVENSWDDSQPFLGDFATDFNDPGAIKVKAGESVTLQLPATDLEDDPVFFGVWDSHSWTTGLDDDFDIDYDPVTGEATLTPYEGVSGVRGILVGVTSVDVETVNFTLSHPNLWAFDLEQELFDYAVDYYLSLGATQTVAETRAADDLEKVYLATWDFQFVPIFVQPATTSAPSLSGGTDTGASATDNLTNINNTSGYLEFLVEGATAESMVYLFVDGVDRGHQEVPAGEDSVIVRSDQLVPLDEGEHEITVQQILKNQSTLVGNNEVSADVPGELSQSITVTIDTTPLTITAVGTTLSAVELEPFTYQVTLDGSADDFWRFELPDDDTHDVPAGMAIDPQTGEITWTPGHEYEGVNEVTVMALDQAGNVATETISISVEVGPDFVPIDPQQVDEHDTLVVDILALDDDTPVAPYLDGTAPAGAAVVFDELSQTWQLQWTPGEAQGPAEYDITVFADSAGGISSSILVHVTVAEVNTAPTIDTIADQTISEGDTLKVDAVAADEDLQGDGSPQTLTYSLEGDVPEGMTIDASTGEIVFLASETQGGQEYDVTVRVVDSLGGSATATFHLTVLEVDEAPVFDVNPTGTPSALIVSGNTLSATVGAQDPDVPTNGIRYELQGDHPGGMAIDPVTGEITWAVPIDYPSGTVDVMVRATEIIDDGGDTPLDGLSSTTKVSIVVADARALAAQAQAMRRQVEEAASRAAEINAQQWMTRNTGLLEVLADAAEQTAARRAAVIGQFGMGALYSRFDLSDSSIGGFRLSPYSISGHNGPLTTTDGEDGQGVFPDLRDAEEIPAPRPISLYPEQDASSERFEGRSDSIEFDGTPEWNRRVDASIESLGEVADAEATQPAAQDEADPESGDS